MQHEVDFQLAPFCVIAARRVIAGDGTRPLRILDGIGAVAQHREHGLCLARGGEEQLDVVVRRGRDKAFQVVARQGDAAHVRRDLLGAHDGQDAQFQIVAHALDGVLAWWC
ncbi:hypothetical protein D3C81_456560 [compost metagenome]